MPVKVLFICTANVQRSPTAARIANKYPEHFEARARGIVGHKEAGGVAVTQPDIDWAEEIVVMEPHHFNMLQQSAFNNLPRCHVLEIPDRYNRDAPALCELLERACAERIGTGIWPMLGLTLRWSAGPYDR